MSINNQVKIKFLIECQEHIPALAKLWYEEISRHWNKDASVEKAKERLISHLNTDKIPMTLVAMHNNDPVGMACLRETDGIRPGIAPWLGSLVVNPNFRSNKIGEKLVETIKFQARNLKYEMLYLLAFDPTIPNWYSRLGWTPIGTDELFGHRVAVMSIQL